MFRLELVKGSNVYRFALSSVCECLDTIEKFAGDCDSRSIILDVVSLGLFVGFVNGVVVTVTECRV